MFCFLAVLPPAYSQDARNNGDTFSTLHDRFRYYVHRTYTSRQRTAFLVADSGLGHLLNDPEEWGRGPETFGVRLASNFGARVVANSIEFGLGAVLQEDARYRSPQLRGFWNRARYATTAAFRARLPDAGTRLAFSRLGAVTGGVLVSSLWHPTAPSAPDLLAGIGFGLLGKVPDNLLSEFSPDLRSAGRKVFKTIRRR